MRGNRWKFAKAPREETYPHANEYLDLLTKAISNPEIDSVPICFRHIRGLADSIYQRELQDTVLVVVGPGVSNQQDRPNSLFCCFLCWKDKSTDSG